MRKAGDIVYFLKSYKIVKAEYVGFIGNALPMNSLEGFNFVTISVDGERILIAEVLLYNSIKECYEKESGFIQRQIDKIEKELEVYNKNFKKLNKSYLETTNE